MPAILILPRDRCLELQEALRKEWLETDGRGGYASSTVLMCPTRRYHGLLVAPAGEAGRRHSFLSRFEEHVHGGEREFPLSMGRYPGTFGPQGHRGIDHVEFVPYPRWHYRIGEVRVQREILRVRGSATVLCRYLATHERSALELRLRPLLTFRDAEALTHENLDLDPRVERRPDGVVCRPYPSLPALAITIGGVKGEFEADPVWYRQIEYWRDLVRGYDGLEDNFSPGWFSLPLVSGQEIVVAATIEDPIEDPVALWHAESARRRAAAVQVPAGLEGMLRLTADDFLFRDRHGRPGVLAGFPWFGEWGRDTFIALPGLTLARGQVEPCGDVLEGVLAFLEDGRLPNVFGANAGGSAYGSVDTPLWYAWAVAAYAEAGGARRRLDDVLVPAVETLAQALLDERQPGVSCDEAGLVCATEESDCLTWMDARVGGVAVTPRMGCAVEVNALWYALLAFLERHHREAGREGQAQTWERRRRKAGKSFLERLWLPDAKRLADRWEAGVADPAVRPNMVIAAALASSPLSKAQRAAIVKKAEQDLLTPVGLRTLGPTHPDYVGRYAGGVEERDRAYHQGTVWPWLMGFYVEACLRARGHGKTERRRLRSLLDGFEQEHRLRGLLHVSEVYDGDPPHAPGGTIAQAWSTSELLRSFALLREPRP